MTVAASEVHRWTRHEYERMAADGFFPPEARVELIEGVVYDMPPQSSGHTTGVHLAAETLRPAFQGCYLRVQSPLALGASSQPEPDIAIVAGSPREYRDAHPAQALLVVEVADQSLVHDRKRKLPLYAAAHIPEVWIMNLRRRTLEVYRDPQEDAYRVHRILRTGDVVAPLARPEMALQVAELLP